MDQDEKLWQEFNDWHRTRYGWRVHEDLRNHPRENYYAWEAWKAGFANGTKTQDTPVERAELEKLAYDLNQLRARVKHVRMAYGLPCDVSDSGLGT